MAIEQIQFYRAKVWFRTPNNSFAERNEVVAAYLGVIRPFREQGVVISNGIWESYLQVETPDRCLAAKLDGVLKEVVQNNGAKVVDSLEDTLVEEEGPEASSPSL